MSQSIERVAATFLRATTRPWVVPISLNPTFTGMKRTLVAVLMLCALGVLGCSNTHRVGYRAGGEANAPAKVLESKRALEDAMHEGALVFDVRDYDDWANAHIDGARTASVADIAHGRALPDNRDAPLVFMGDGPLDLRPESAARIAAEKGYTRVSLYVGGWAQWTDK